MSISLYAFFHLNLNYSSIEEKQRPEIIRRCYWPLLNLAREYDLPFGIEASGYTLETAAAIDPTWLAELRRLTTEGPCEFIGSGYAQIIGPLVPAEVNAANLRLGHQEYERLLGFRPQIALVNEQTYSPGLVQHYLDAGYRTIVMEWDNPARFHPEWDPEWRYLPQFTCGQYGEEIPVIWNQSIAFQKFQRYAHGDITLDEYFDYLVRHISDSPRAFPLYGNDAEVFDFRPDRYNTEGTIRQEGEWILLKSLFEALLSDQRFSFIRPSQVLELMQVSGGGNRLHLESREQPIPVKKQEKYNITRWAVTGRDDLSINTACWRIYEALKTNPEACDDDWRELCFLWSSDFRTHITEKRWNTYQERLSVFEKQVISIAPRRATFESISEPSPLPRTTCREPPLREPQGRELVEPAGRTTERPARECGDEPRTSGVGQEDGLVRGECCEMPRRATPQSHERKSVVRGLPSLPVRCAQTGPFSGEEKFPRLLKDCGSVERDGRYLAVETDTIKVRLNCRRGLTIDGLWFKGVSDRPLVGTLPHGYYDDISLGADFYTGHLVLELPGRPQVTDLDPTEPEVKETSAWVGITGTVITDLGPIQKEFRIFRNLPRVELEYYLHWQKLPLGLIRVGHITLNPEAFDRSTLFYRTHNGGYAEETYPLAGSRVNHGDAISSLVSARTAIGLTGGMVELGDATHAVRVEVDNSLSALIGLMTYREVGNTYFCRLAFSAGEMDETRQPLELASNDGVTRHIRIVLTASNHERGRFAPVHKASPIKQAELANAVCQ